MTGRSVCRSWSPITGVLPLHGHLSGSSAGRRSWSPITGVLPYHGRLALAWAPQRLFCWAFLSVSASPVPSVTFVQVPQVVGKPWGN